MAAFLNPVQGLSLLIDVFDQGSGTAGGITLDEGLCRNFSEALRELEAGVAPLVDFAASHGLVQAIPPERDRTPVERQRLARLAVPLDPERRVLAFPQAPVRFAAVTEGGSAA